MRSAKELSAGIENVDECALKEKGGEGGRRDCPMIHNIG